MTMMKMTDKFLSAVMLTAAAFCASCSTENLAEQQQEQLDAKAVSLTATMDEAVTRAGIGKAEAAGKALCYWYEGDKILVQTQNPDGTYTGTKFYTDDATGSTTATFWGEPLSGATLGGVALYPYSKEHQFTDEKSFIYNLPASYTYTTVGQEIFSNTEAGTKTYPTNSTNVPMLGTIDSENNSIHFSHIGGLVVIRVDKMPFEAGTLTVSADQQLSGNFPVDLTTASAIATASTETEADKKVTFTFSGATEGGVGVFYLPLATGSYTNMRVEIKGKDANKWWVSSNRTLSIARASVTAVPLVAADMGIIVKNDDGTYTVNDKYKFIDLGLDELWAETNVGATKAADYGTYIARSDIASATSDWGAPCSMPTTSQFQTLRNNCDWEKTTQTNSSNEAIYGWTVKSKTNSSSIFLPIAGRISFNGFNDAGIEAYYWPSLEGNKLYININSNGYLSSEDVWNGSCFPVRLVVEKPE